MYFPSLLIVPQLAGICIILNYLARSLRKYLLKKETILLDLPLLGKAREEADKIKGTAVICGGRYVNSPRKASGI